VKPKMINPARYIAYIDAVNELEKASKKINRYGLNTDKVREALSTYQYSVTWDSFANRWTLVSETDEAPVLCSFNQTTDECSETNLCEQCRQTAEANAEHDDDNNAAYKGF
jgi:hypothetical protein